MNYKVKYKMAAYMQISTILAVDTLEPTKQNKVSFLVQVALKTLFPSEMHISVRSVINE
jgi:hypothetical protein